MSNLLREAISVYMEFLNKNLEDFILEATTNQSAAYHRNFKKGYIFYFSTAIGLSASLFLFAEN